MTLSRDGARPVEAELIEFFKQNKRTCVTATETIEIFGHSRSGKSIRDNLYILATLGFLCYDKRKRWFSLSPNAEKADFTRSTRDMLPKPTRSPKQKPSNPTQQPKPNSHCDKCHHKFRPGEKSYVRSFANAIQLYLCAECYMPKVLA